MSSLFSRLRAATLPANIAIAGEEINYQHGGNDEPVAVQAIWIEVPEQLTMGVRAIAWIRGSDIDSLLGGLVAKGDVVTRGNDRFRVIDPPNGAHYSRDGNGGINLHLQQISRG